VVDAPDPSEWPPEEDPNLHRDGAHPADCGCALPPNVVLIMQVDRNGNVTMGRRCTRPFASKVLRHLADTVDLAHAVDQVEDDMPKGEEDGS
jgi:hypothetical protein